MKQLKLVLTVNDSEGKVIFSKDPATPQDFSAALGLFASSGNKITADIVELDIEIPQNN